MNPIPCCLHLDTDRSRLRASAGFTLIELMLAVALLGIILVMLAGSFSAVSHGKIHAESRLNIDHEARSIMWQLSKELRGVVMTQNAPSNTLLIGQGQTQSGLPLDSIVFSTFDVGHRKSLDGYGAEEIVSYSAVPNPNHRGLFVLLRSQHSGLLQLDSNLASPPVPLVLSENVMALHLRYFDGTRWHEGWDSDSSPAGLNIPQAISIQLQMAAPGGRPVFLSTEVAIPMAFTQR
jgi:prepilin-type N-terminal cleavage/methylation domain-containing protein